MTASAPDHLPPQVTLPALLAHQAEVRPTSIALRHKHLGIWQSWTWRELQQQTLRYVTILSAEGISNHTKLILLSRPRVEALLLSLAAQSLGAVVAPLDPELSAAELSARLALIRPDVIFAEGQTEVDLLLESGNNHNYTPTLILYANGRGLGSYIESSLRSLTHLLNHLNDIQIWDSVAKADTHAFVFYDRDSSGNLIQQALSHQRLIEESQHLITNYQLTAQDEALAARAFATAGQARYLLAPWLVVGLRLNFPENLATRDHDRRELAPTLVLGSKATYARVADLAAQKLPSVGSVSRRVYEWAQQPRRNPIAWILRKIYRRSLRENLGFARLRTALLVGEQLGKNHIHFYQSLGIQIHNLASAGATADSVVIEQHHESDSDLTTAQLLAGVAENQHAQQSNKVNSYSGAQ